MINLYCGKKKEFMFIDMGFFYGLNTAKKAGAGAGGDDNIKETYIVCTSFLTRWPFG